MKPLLHVEQALSFVAQQAGSWSLSINAVEEYSKTFNRKMIKTETKQGYAAQFEWIDKPKSDE